MLQALGVLGGVYEGWQQGKEDQRRRRLQDLKAEGYELRNDSYRMSNEYDEKTFDTRVENEFQTTRKTTAQAGSAEWVEAFNKSRAEVQKLTAPFQVDEARNVANLRGQQARGASAQADTNEINAQIAADTQVAKTRGVIASNASEELSFNIARTDEMLDRLASQMELEGFDTLNVNPNSKGTVVEVLRGMGVPADDVSYQNGQVYMLQEGEDGQVSVIDSVSEEDFANTMTDPEFSKKFLQQLNQDRGAQQLVSGQVTNLRDNLVEESKNYGAQRVAYQDASAAKPQYEELEGEAVTIRGRIHALEKTKSRGFGSADNNAPIDAEISELQGRLAEIEATAGELESTHGELLAMSPEELAAADEEVAANLSSLGSSFERGIGNISIGAQEAERSALANPDELDVETAVRNQFSLGNNPAVLNPTEVVQNRADTVQANDAITASLNDSFQSVIDNFQGSVDARELKDRGMPQSELESGIRSIKAAVFRSGGAGDMVAAATGTPRQRLGFEVLMNHAMHDHITQGGDAGTYVDGTLANWSPDAIAMASQFANDEGFAGVPDGRRVAAVHKAVQLMEEQGMSSSAARTRALAWANQ